MTPIATDIPARNPDIPTRDRIVYASAELFRRQGYAGTGLKQIATEARAPFGSVYHFFPGGKEQLAGDVLRAGGRFFLALYEAIADAAPDLPTAVGDFFAGAAQTLEATDYADACPIATVAGEIASTHEVLRQATADVFESWLAGVARDAVAAGVPADRARPLALSVLAVLEGAFLLSRSLRSTEPMQACAEAAVALVEAALAQEPTTAERVGEPSAAEATREPTAAEATREPTAAETTREPTTLERTA